MNTTLVILSTLFAACLGEEHTVGNASSDVQADVLVQADEGSPDVGDQTDVGQDVGLEPECKKGEDCKIGGPAVCKDGTCEPVDCDIVEFEDENLELQVLLRYDDNEDGIVQGFEIKDVTQFNFWSKSTVPGTTDNIKSLAGIECFFSLEKFTYQHAAPFPEVEDLTPLTQLKNLKSLGIHGSSITDISVLGSMTQLEELWIAVDTQIDTIDPLAGLTNLKILHIEGTYPSIDVLAGMPDLEYVVIKSPMVTSLEPLSDLSNMHSLNLYLEGLVDPTPLEGLTSLWRLYMEGAQLSDITFVETLIGLNQLLLVNAGIVDITPVASLPTLNELNLGGNDIVDIAPVAAFTQMKFLTLRDNQIVDLDPLSGLAPKLRILRLQNNKVVEVEPLNSFGSQSGIAVSSTKLELAGNPIDCETQYEHLVELPVDADELCPQ